MYDIPHFIQNPLQVDRLSQALDTGQSDLLSSVKIKLTSFCNLRCQMCRYWKTRHEESLSTQQWVEVLSQLAELGCRKVHFSGGEVFLRRDFLELVEWGTHLKLKINLTTNGTLLTPDRLRRLLKARPNSVSLSLDGPKAAIHDAIRGLPGSFKRTTRVIARLVQGSHRSGHACRVRINYVMQKQNFKFATEMVELAARLGATELHPMPVDEKGERKNRLSPTQILRYNQEIAPAVAEARRQAGFSTRPWMVYPFGESAEEIECSRRGQYALGLYRDRPCLSPWMHLFIGWDGETYLCCMTHRRTGSLGNVAKQGLAEIFNGLPMREVRQRFLDLQMEGACARCDMVSVENRLLHQALEKVRPSMVEAG